MMMHDVLLHIWLVAKCLRVPSLKLIAKSRHESFPPGVKSQILQVHFSVSYLTALLQENRWMIKNVDGKKVEGLSALNYEMSATSSTSTSACSRRREGTWEIKALGI